MRDTYVRIGQAARLAGVSVDTLRRWEAEGKLSPPRTLGGQRSYRLADIENLRDGGEEDDRNGDAPVVVSAPPRLTPAPMPPWKAREANAAADLSVTKLRIDQREEVRRYHEAQQRRFDAQRAEAENRDEEARLHAEQREERQRQQRALDKCLQSIRLFLPCETSAVRAEVERFLADNATLGASIPWIEAQANAILDRHRSEREAEAQREREARSKQHQAAAQQVADAIRRSMLLRSGHSFANKLTADREEWDADIAHEAVQEVWDHLSEVLDPAWSEKRVEREVAEMLTEWD